MSIHCAYCIHDKTGNYYINILVSLVSMFENTNEKVVIHLLHDETLTETARQDLDELCVQYGQEIEYHFIGESNDSKNFGATERFPNTYVKFLVPSVLGSLSKALYLDADIIFDTDIKELFAIDLKDKMLAAVKDFTLYWREDGTVKDKYLKDVKFLGLREETYFNTGVLLLNLDILRGMEVGGVSPFLKRLKEALANNIMLKFQDQDIFNSVMAEKTDKLMFIDSKFNFIITKNHLLYSRLRDFKGKVVHMTSKPDVWTMPAQLLHWKYYAKTKYRDDVFEQMNNVYHTTDMNFLFDYCCHPSRRKAATLYLKYGFWGMLLYKCKKRLGLVKKD